MGDRAHVLATREGVSLVAILLAGSGALCPDCGHGTKATSKRWAKCKKCGRRVARRDMGDVAREIRDGEAR